MVSVKEELKPKGTKRVAILYAKRLRDTTTCCQNALKSRRNIVVQILTRLDWHQQQMRVCQ